jgi:hypothetical protein
MSVPHAFLGDVSAHAAWTGNGKKDDYSYLIGHLFTTTKCFDTKIES